MESSANKIKWVTIKQQGMNAPLNQITWFTKPSAGIYETPITLFRLFLFRSGKLYFLFSISTNIPTEQNCHNSFHSVDNIQISNIEFEYDPFIQYNSNKLFLD